MLKKQKLIFFGLFFSFLVIVTVAGNVVLASNDFVTEINGNTDVLASIQAETSNNNEHESGHTDPVAPVLMCLVVILIAAKIGGQLFEKFNQPAVLGELVFGIFVGNMHLFGITVFQDLLGSEAYIDILSRLGVIILLFMVGLESNIKEMLKVGVPSLMVAAVGVIAPFFLGFITSKIFLAEAGFNVHLFIGATLTATSVGITARVFKDLGKLQLPEAKIILGAAVIDDIMGLIVLAVVSGIITTGSMSLLSIGVISFKSIAFLVGSIVIGTYTAPAVGRWMSKMDIDGMKVIFALIVAFIFSWVANFIGLATIVGAFAAGLILDEVHFCNCRRKNHNGECIPEMTFDELIRPIAHFLVPVFFVMMGMQVKLETFLDIKVLGIAATLTIAAILGKQACGLVVKKNYNRLIIGIGMIPRGEVGLIFATIGKELGVVNDSIFSAIIIMVIVTTLIAPFALKKAIDKMEKVKV